MKTFVFALVWVIVVMLFALTKDNNPDLSQDGGYEPCTVAGHPLYQDC